MSFELSQEFTFEAAHTLKRSVPLVEFTPSSRIHGHSYSAKVTVSGEIGASGMVEKFSLKKNQRSAIDLFYLRAEIAKVRAQIDHQFLDEVPGIETPTLENLCLFIYNSIKPTMPVSCVTVSRVTGGDSCSYCP